MSVRRSERAPKPKKIELTLAITPRANRGSRRGGKTSSKRGRPKVETVVRTPNRTPRVTKEPWEMDEEYEEEVHDEDEDDEGSESFQDNTLDFDDYDEELDLDSIPAVHYEEVPEEAFCPWLELSYDEIPVLDLPSSSNDLVLPSSLLLDALEVYELCRSFYRALYISPFHFEDFCASLSTSENTSLLSELHICFFKMCLRDDDEEQVQYTVMDTHNSFNILIQLLEPLTYAEIIRRYAEADPRVGEDVMQALNDPTYPFVAPQLRLSVLRWFGHRFLESQEFKKIIKNDGRIVSEDRCRECNKGGDLLPCDTCEAAFHLVCLEMSDVPEGQWSCAVCKVHKVKGVTDCLPIGQAALRQPLRMNVLGRDRHGRLYTFAARRIFVSDEKGEQVVYYSTAPQMHELASRLDADRLELALCQQLSLHLPTIIDQMAVTLELTNERNVKSEQTSQQPSPPYLHIDNLNRFSDILSDCVARPSAQNPVDTNEEDDVTQSLTSRIEKMMGIRGGRLAMTFWSGGCDEHGVLEHSKERSIINEPDDPKQGFRLGRDDLGFRTYTNHFSIAPLAKPAALRMKERDKKKYMCGRFSLSEEGHFEWSLAKGKDLYGSQLLTSRYIEWMMNKMYKRIPPELMHRRWAKEAAEKFSTLVATGRNVELFKEALLLLECGMRKTLFLPQWWNSLGTIVFCRMTLDEREQRSKVDVAKKKSERELVTADGDDESVVWVKYTRLGGPPRHNIWKLKDEQYRVNGRDDLGGWVWTSATLTHTLTVPPTKEEEQWEKKRVRVEGCVQPLMEKRTKEEEKKKERVLVCFSPLCGKSKRKCYSLACAVNSIKLDALAAGEAKREEKWKKLRELGGDEPWPLPQPLTFKKRNGKKSVFVLQSRYLRRMARTGGVNASVAYPGFSHTAKSNPYVWNYPTYRPLFDLCWKYNTLCARSLHAVALQLRLLWAAVRWADFNPDDEKEKKVVIHHADRDEVREVIGHKEMPPDGTYERYEVALTAKMLDGDYEVKTEDEEEDNNPSSTPTPSRSDTSRKRKAALKAANMTSKRKVLNKTTKWVDGVDLKLYEIRDYWLKVRAKKMEAQQMTMSGRPLRQGVQMTNGRYVPMNEGTVPAVEGGPSAKRARYDLDSTVTKMNTSRVGSGGYAGGTTPLSVLRRQHQQSLLQQQQHSALSPHTYAVRQTPQGGLARRLLPVTPSSASGPPRRVVQLPDGRRMAVRYVMGEHGVPMRMLTPLAPTVGVQRVPAWEGPSAGSPSTQTHTPNAPAGKFFVIRNSDGSTKVLRTPGVNHPGSEGEGPMRVAMSRSAMGTPSAYRWGNYPSTSQQQPIYQQRGRMAAGSDEYAGSASYRQNLPHLQPQQQPTYRNEWNGAGMARVVYKPSAAAMERIGMRSNVYHDDDDVDVDDEEGEEESEHDDPRYSSHPQPPPPQLLQRRSGEARSRVPVVNEEQRRIYRAEEGGEDEGRMRGMSAMSPGGMRRPTSTAALPQMVKMERVAPAPTSTPPTGRRADGVRSAQQSLERRVAVAPARHSEQQQAQTPQRVVKKEESSPYSAHRSAEFASEEEVVKEEGTVKQTVKEERVSGKEEKEEEEEAEGSGAGRSKMKCVCMDPYDASRVYVKCSGCECWMHAVCVGVSERRAKRLNDWKCPQCTATPHSDDPSPPGVYCLCKKKYDDKQFYVGCDFCDDWFHPHCVGITEKAAQAMATYKCPNCAKKESEHGKGRARKASDGKRSSLPSPNTNTRIQLTQQDMPLVMGFLQRMMGERQCEPFRYPVDVKVYPEYKIAVKHPMDLTTMVQKVQREEYASVEQLEADFLLMFRNARAFNEDGSEIAKMTTQVERIFNQRLVTLRRDLSNRR